MQVYEMSISPVKNKVMECVICKKGTTEKVNVIVTLDRGGSIIAIKEVPAQICNNCEKYYLSTEITSEVLKKQKKLLIKALK